jgi:HSP20 family protein
MTLVKWSNPSKGLTKTNEFFPPMESFFKKFFNDDLSLKDQAGFVPSVNVTENEHSYSIEASAPGFEKKDFNVRVEDGVLTISAEHRAEQKTEEEKFVRKEFNYGSFSRSFNLADLVDEEKIDARYENGILKVKLPKNEKAKAKRAKHIAIG